MIDIKLIREKPEVVIDSLRKRDADVGLVENIQKADQAWRSSLQKMEKLKAERNAVNMEIAKAKQAGQDASKKISEMRKISGDIAALEKKTEEQKAKVDAIMLDMPNILHESVPKGESEEDNEVIKTVGKPTKFAFEPKGHIELCEALDLVDIERAAKVSGARFYYLKNEAVQLEFALVRFVLDKLKDKGFVLTVPPALIRGKVMEGAGFLPAGKDDIYKIEGDDLYLVGTSEQALAGLHMDEIIDKGQLPLYYAGFSPCFRTEAGSHGKDTKGIFRVHQFDKIEMFKFTAPEKSWGEHDSLLAVAEEIYKELKIPYRVVNVCSGEMGNVAAKKYDIEAWFPSQNTYREIVSCSNCTDYQGRRLNCRCRASTNDKPEVVHTLNSTACAVGRTLVAIIENYQKKDGSIEVPEVLGPYLGFKEIKG